MIIMRFYQNVQKKGRIQIPIRIIREFDIKEHEFLEVEIKKFGNIKAKNHIYESK